MVCYLNPFYPVVKTPKGYEFPENNVVIETSDNSYEELMQRLIGKNAIEESEISDIIGEEELNSWKEKKLLINKAVDDKGIYSRSGAYYYHKSIEGSQAELARKKVMILGCGGIGSHVAWNLTVMGVGTVYLVDYDTIEISNLNRQILYDSSDIGKLKASVLEEKLRKINPFIKIQAINKKISSEEDLEELVVSNDPDLIIKSADSPLYFPKWLDAVCIRHSKKYIAGIISGTAQMIGPTFVPGKSCCYTDFFDIDEDKERVFGMGPSVGFVMYQLSGQISEEAFKVLIGKGDLSFKNRIVLYDNLTDKEVVIRPRKKLVPNSSDKKKTFRLVSVAVILAINLITILMGLPLATSMLPVMAYIVLAPAVMSGSAKEAFGHAFIFLVCSVMISLIRLTFGGALEIVSRSMILSLVSMIYTFLGLFVVGLAVGETTIFKVRKFISRKGGESFD